MVRDGKQGQTPKSWPSGGGLGVNDVINLIGTYSTSAIISSASLASAFDPIGAAATVFTQTCLRSQNLSDLANPPAALQNLGIVGWTPIGDANYNMASTDRFIALAALLTAPRTITLAPASAVPPGLPIYVVDGYGQTNLANLVSVAPSGTDKINNVSAAYLLARQYGIQAFVSDGVSHWTTDQSQLNKFLNLSELTSPKQALANLTMEGMATTVDADYAIGATAKCVSTNAALTNTRNWQLPYSSAVNAGREIILMDGVAAVGTYKINIVANVSDVLRGATPVLSNTGAILKAVSNGVNSWIIQNTNTTPWTQIGDSNYSISATDRFVALISLLSTPRTLTLPAASAVQNATTITVLDLYGQTNLSNIASIVPQSFDKLNQSSAAFQLNRQFGTQTFISDGISHWTTEVSYMNKLLNLSDITSPKQALANLTTEGIVNAVDANYGIANTAKCVSTNAVLTSARTWQLPYSSAVNGGREVILMDGAGVVGTYNITIAPQGVDALRGVTPVLSAAGACLRAVSNGNNAWVLK